MYTKLLHNEKMIGITIKTQKIRKIDEIPLQPKILKMWYYPLRKNTLNFER